MLTRNPLLKQNDAEIASLQKENNPYDETTRKMDVAKAQENYRLTGDVKPLQDTLQRVDQKELGGSVQKFNIDSTIEKTNEQEYQRKVDVAKKAYQENPNDTTASNYKAAIEEGNKIFSPQSTTGMNIQSAVRSLGGAEIDRKVDNLKADWKADPEAYRDEYKQALQDQINYYGKDSSQAAALQETMRSVDEESLLNTLRNAKVDYQNDPEASYGKMIDAEKALIDFYGSSSDGYYAKQALVTMDKTEQDRLDTQASSDYQVGAIGYEGYHNYLNAQMSKYEDGSTSYLKYYKAAKDLEFKKGMDDIIRTQYNTPPGQVIQSLKSMQSSYAQGSTAYNQYQDQIDVLTKNLRYEAYKQEIKNIVKDRQSEINDYKAKLYILDQDFASGKISTSKYTKKYKNYNNKLDYLSDSNNLPSFEIWNNYGTNY